eukprot:962691-Amphidinium_carterae.1
MAITTTRKIQKKSTNDTEDESQLEKDQHQETVRSPGSRAGEGARHSIERKRTSLSVLASLFDKN